MHLTATTFRNEDFRKKLPELVQLKILHDRAGEHYRSQIETTISAKNLEFPVYSFEFGSTDPDAPVFIVVGGVHGLERIGTNLAIAFIKNLNEWLSWDCALTFLMERCRICVYPLVNPGGMYSRTRSNLHGVDLMRNAPVEAEVTPNIRLVGGHRISPHLPWYRGIKDAPMETETNILINFVREKIKAAPFSLLIDLHSGFGIVDRVWYPYAHSFRDFPGINDVLALKKRLDRSLPNHVYIMEAQSKTYITHGDLWDFVTLQHQDEKKKSPFIALTLEMGSWLWIRKNPRQAFSTLGIFNPILPHRIQRTLRRHLTLLEFLMRATASYSAWIK